MDSNVLRSASLLASTFSIVAGGLGMGMSFLFLSSANMADITAGTSGFIAGAVLAGSGLVSLAMLSRGEPAGHCGDMPTTEVK